MLSNHSRPDSPIRIRCQKAYSLRADVTPT